MRHTFSYDGLPLRVVTDNGPQFTSHEFKDFMSANGIKHQLTPPYHPASNGQVERMVQEFKKSLKTKPTGRSVSHQVSIFLLHYRTTPNSTTGKIPAELMLKRSPRTRLSILHPEADSELREAQSQQYGTASGRVRQLQPGMTVSVTNPRQDSRGKWLCGVIIQRLGPATYLVSVEGGPRYAHIDQLRERDGRTFSEYTWEPTGDISVPTMNQDNGNSKQKDKINLVLQVHPQAHHQDPLKIITVQKKNEKTSLRLHQCPSSLTRYHRLQQ